MIKIGNKEFELKIADGFFSRLLGLMFKKKLDDNKALLITQCPSIHTFFMRFPISVVFVDEEGKVLKYVKNIKPCRMSFCNNACSVIEFSYIGNENIEIKNGDFLSLP